MIASPEQQTITGFALPEDGWYHIAVPGEWPHKPTGLVQVVDEASMQSIVSDFTEAGSQPHWPGVLIDFDHQSLDEDKPTTAAGWIIELDKRASGIWAKVRWSDLGRKSIEGGRYRFISPVWRSTDCDMLENDRIRPLKLMNCAVTNDPNIKGLFPLSNACLEKPLRFSLPAVSLANSTKPARMTDDERKAMFAAMGHRGGGGGGSGGGGGGSPSRRRELPPRPPATQAAQQYARQIEQLKQQRENLERNRRPRPRPHEGFDRVNAREAAREAFQSGKITATQIADYRRNIEQQNRRRRNELTRIKRNIRDQYKTPEQQERALARYLRRQETEHSKAVDKWTRANRYIDQDIAKIDRKIHEFEIRIAREEDKLVREEIRAEIARDKEVYRQRRDGTRDDLAQTREERLREQFEAREARYEEEANQKLTPVQAYRAELTRRRTYYEAVERGDLDYAERLAPGADHRRVSETIKRINGGGQGQADRRAREALRDDVFSRPPPMPEDDLITSI